jgi:hypothetical protein
VAPPEKSLNAGDCRRTVDIRRYASERGTFLYENIVFFISSLLIPTESLQSLFFFLPFLAFIYQTAKWRQRGQIKAEK